MFKDKIPLTKEQRPNFDSLYKKVFEGDASNDEGKKEGEKDPNTQIKMDNYEAKDGTSTLMSSPSIAQIFMQDNHKFIDRRSQFHARVTNFEVVSEW